MNEIGGGVMDRNSGMGIIGCGWGKGVGGDVDIGMEGKGGMNVVNGGNVKRIE